MEPAPVVETKPWYQSKVLWLNAITFLIGVLALFHTAPDLLPAEWDPWIVITMAILNLLLRMVTGDPIAGTPADPYARRGPRNASG